MDLAVEVLFNAVKVLRTGSEKNFRGSCVLRVLSTIEGLRLCSVFLGWRVSYFSVSKILIFYILPEFCES